MSLSIVIPCHNDAEGLSRLLTHLRGFHLNARVIIVDDGSDIPVALPAEQVDMRPLENDILLLRHETPQGPGVARNMGLAHVTTQHVLFLDADDLPTRELPFLMADLEGKDFDFCLFQHHDTRRERELSWGQLPHDLALWQDAGCDLGALTRVDERARQSLVQTANYPWNKIYATAFLRRHNIGCSEILLHEDIELHWRGFLLAETILCSDRVGVIHFVMPDGTRLTNHRGVERLDVFTVLPDLVREIQEINPELYEEACLTFLMGLVSWMRGVVSPDILPELDRQAEAFFRSYR